jgi:hypothetical protein
MSAAETIGPPRERRLKGFLALNRNNTDDVPEAPGVYLLWQLVHRDSWKLFYVGNADNLRAMLNRHIGTTEPDAHIRRRVSNCVLAFEYLPEARGKTRDGLVKFLAQSCRPEHVCDIRRPDVEPVQVSLSEGRKRLSSDPGSRPRGPIRPSGWGLTAIRARLLVTDR